MSGSEEEQEATTPDALGATLEEKRAPAIPQWLGERYQIKRVLGKGGMGAVYLAVDQALKCDVALKEVIIPGDALERLRDEVLLAQKVTHPNVCRSYDLEEVDGRWLVKMEYIDGESLAARLARGPLPVAEAVRVAVKVCAGLTAAHERGVVHRDIKPHNLMLEAPTGRVVIMDFGIARAAALAGKTAENVSGTPEYMAPEQVRGREVDGRADLYALGCVLYEMLTGERPFKRDSAMATALAHVNDPPPALPKSVPSRVVRAVARLLEKDPARRPAHAVDVAAQLVGPPRRSPWLWATAAMAAATVVAVVALRPRHRWEPKILALPVHDEDTDFGSFSPDGALFAFASDREVPGLARIYVATLDGAARVVTTPGRQAVEPRWAPDGKSLFVVTDEAGFRVPLDGGEPELLARGARRLEPCGGRILYTIVGTPDCNMCTRMVLREADGQERDVIRFTPAQILAVVRCDREGRRVLYSLADRVPTDRTFWPTDLWLLSLDGGSARQLTHDHALNMGTFTPDGRSIVYCATHDGASHLWEMALDAAHPPTQLTFGQGWEYVPDVSSDGRLVMYNVDLGTDEIFSQPLAGGPAHRITSGLQNLFHLRTTPDGHAIIAQAFSDPTHPGIVRIPVDGGEAMVLAQGKTPSLTPDGREVVYSVGDEVLAVPIEGGAPRTVGKAPGAIQWLHAGPDDRIHMTVAQSQGWEAWGVARKGGRVERELPAPWIALFPAPSGGWRAKVMVGRARMIAPGAALDSPDAREIEAEGDPAWTPDGLSFAFLRAGEIHRYFVETGEDRKLVDAPDAIGSVAVSPDGATLYTSRLVGRARRELITNFADRPRP